MYLLGFGEFKKFKFSAAVFTGVLGYVCALGEGDRISE